MTKHTPTPWIANGRWIGVQNHKSYIGQCYDQNGNLVTDAPMAIANAEFIVRAVNSHDALVEVLEDAEKALDLYGDKSKGSIVAALNNARVTLSKAKGE